MNSVKKKKEKRNPRKVTKAAKLFKGILFAMMAAFGLYAWNKFAARSLEETIVTKMNNLAEDTWTNVKVSPEFVSDPAIENILMSNIS